MLDDIRSQHPVDRLIRELIATRRAPEPLETAAIVDRIATAPFDSQTVVPVRMKHRGLTYQGEVLGARASTLTYHLVKRVIDDEQWAFGTTAAEYLADLRQAARSLDVSVLVYERRGGCMAATISPNRIPAVRRGLNALPWMLVVLSADRGMIVSGYQTSSDRLTNIPEDALWLR
jgi:hypothetical protein